MSEQRRVQAAVFDVDGTILDSRDFITGAYLYSLAHHGVADTETAAIAAVIGLPLQECYHRLAPGVDFESLRTQHREFHLSHPELLRAYPGAEATLRALGGRGVRRAVFTSYGPAVVDNLDRFGLNSFDAVVHGESVTRHKPHPEGFLLATAEMGVQPRNAVMIGDAAVDILAGKAGLALATIGISHGFGRVEDLRAAGADYIVDSLEEVPAVIDELEAA